MKLHSASALDLEHGRRNVCHGLAIEELNLIKRSNTGAVLVSCSVSFETVVERLAGCRGCAPPIRHGATVPAGERRMIWMTPRSRSVTCRQEYEDEHLQSIVREFPDRELHASRFSDYLRWLELNCSNVEDTLWHGCFISFDPAELMPGQAKRTPIADIWLILLSEKGGTRLVGVERTRPAFFFEWLKTLTRN